MKRLFSTIRKSFVAGLFLALPAAVTAYALLLGFRLLSNLSRPALEAACARLGLEVYPGFAAIVSLLLTGIALVLLGFLGRSYLGSRLIRLMDALALKIPLAKTLYSATRRLVDSFAAQASFQKVVLVQFPREGAWSMGFCTGDSGRIMGEAGSEFVNVYIPTTPNPTSGYLVMFPRREVRFLDLSVEEGLTFVLSGGIASPGTPESPR